MKRVLIAPALALTLGCASTPIRTSSSAYLVPAEVGEFKLTEIADQPDPALGFSARYAGANPNQRLDVFVSSALNLPFETSAADALWVQFEATTSELEAAASRTGSRLSLASEERLRLRTWHGVVDGVIAVHRGEDASGTPVYLLTYLTILGTDFVTGRATASGAKAAEEEGSLRVVCEALLRELRPREQPPEKREFALFTARDLTPRMTDGRLWCGAAFEQNYGMRIAWQLAHGGYLRTAERELAAREWAVTVNPRECEKDGPYSDLVAIHRAGYGGELMWLQPDPHWGEPVGLQMEEFEEFVRTRIGGRALPGRIPARIRFRSPGRREGGSVISVTSGPR